MSTAQFAAINILLGLLSSAIVAMADATIENRAHVKLAPGVDPSYLKRYGSARPLFSLPYDTLKELSAAEPGLPDLTLWYEVKTEPSVIRGAAKGAFHLFREVDKDFVTEFFIPVHAPPPQARRRVQSDTPGFEGYQGYLYQNVPGTNGIDAEYSWTFPGGNGEGITIYDIEFSWNVDHEDLVDASIPTILNPGDEGIDIDNDDSHGTAVLGELVGSNNVLGVKGISYGAQAKVVPVETINGGYNLADAILRAVYDGKPGDVILIEQQTSACGGICGLDHIGCGPSEEYLDVWEATKVAVANNFVVVAAAGNGNVNLDGPECEGRYDNTNPDRGDSGAIIVGAGGSGESGCLRSSSARHKLDFSTYGSRVDVHGWGECVWTTGGTALDFPSYYDPTNPSDQNKWYIDNFGGTSSASPFVAAAVANIQGIAMKQFGSPLEPKEVRKLLTETGLSQEGPDVDKNIGPLVNLRNAIDKLLGGEIMDDEIITIQAESYAGMFGVTRENTIDEGGGENIASIQKGDWMYYPAVRIPTTGEYTVSYRVASLCSGGALQFENASGSKVYGTIDIPATGGYQTWTTISHIVTLSAGSRGFGILATGGDCDWSMNWFAITKV